MKTKRNEFQSIGFTSMRGYSAPDSRKERAKKKPFLKCEVSNRSARFVLLDCASMPYARTKKKKKASHMQDFFGSGREKKKLA